MTPTRQAVEQLQRICTCDRPPVPTPDGGVKAPGPHTSNCVRVLAPLALQQARAAAFRDGFKAALAKVAEEWASRGLRGHDDVQSVEVQAFLDTRHVHYPECREQQAQRAGETL